MNGEMWQFLALVIVFVVALVAAYGFVFLPGRTPDDLLSTEERRDESESGGS